MAKKRVLIVDDEDDILEILGYNIEKRGYEVLKAKNGIEGIEKARKYKPHLIISDIRMPEMNGIQMCRELRVDFGLEIPVVFLTADPDEYVAIAALSAGGSHYLTKPVKPSIVTGIVDFFIGKEMANTFIYGR